MSLTQSTTVTLGNLRYSAHVTDVDVTLRPLPGVNLFRVSLPFAVEVNAAPGDRGSLELDAGDGAATIIKGKVRGLRRDLMRTQVIVGDAGAELSRFRPSATYERQNGKAVVRALASDIGVSVGTLDFDLPLAAYVSHQSRTAAEHVAYLANLAGATAVVDGEGNLNVTRWPEGPPDVALLYGREIVAYEVQEQPGAAVRPFRIGNGPAGSAEAPEALRHASGRLPSDAPPPGVDAVWQAVPLLRTPSAARTATVAAETATVASGKRIAATCFLLPKLRPGQIVEIQNLPDVLSAGPWMVTEVRHRLQPRSGGMTCFTGRAAGSAGVLGSLLDVAASAVGALV